MISSLFDFLAVVAQLYPTNLPNDIALLKAAQEARSGGDIAALARDVHTLPRRLQRIAEAEDPLAEAFSGSLTVTQEDALARASSILGQLLLGQIAERAFEELYKTEIGTEQLVLEDQREGRTETDFRVMNGEKRPVFRLNIKFHGTLFQKAREMVGLDPEDCFALATYKIHQALAKERLEVLPYVFAVVSVPGMTAQEASRTFPADVIEFVTKVGRCRISGKRAVEERAVAFLLGDGAPEGSQEAVNEFIERIKAAPWTLISATKADRLLREMLFERVYAVRVRGFARNYRNAELDMHFSLSRDMTSLREFLSLVRETGLHGITAHLSRGLV